MTREEAILYLEHTSGDDFNLEEQQIQNRLNAIQFLLKENQELKEKLDKYENPEDMNLFAMWCTEKVKDENLELKKQLEENKDKINWYENFEINKTIDKLRIKHNNQQKDFINFLEDNYKETQDIWYIKILQKYKSIIGGK